MSEEGDSASSISSWEEGRSSVETIVTGPESSSSSYSSSSYSVGVEERERERERERGRRLVS